MLQYLAWYNILPRQLKTLVPEQDTNKDYTESFMPISVCGFEVERQLQNYTVPRSILGGVSMLRFLWAHPFSASTDVFPRKHNQEISITCRNFLN